MDNHLMYCAEQDFSVGTWGGRVLTGFTVRCGNCRKYFVVDEEVIERGGSIFTVRAVRDLTCPYCATTAPTTPDQERILETHRHYDD